MDTLSLQAHPRSELRRRVHALRRRGAVPAVVYGHRQEPLAIQADEHTLERIWHRAGRTHLIDLVIDGQQPRKVIIRELQRSPRNGRLLHADFFAVNLREKMTADIPLLIVGESPAVTEAKTGQILQTMSSVRVECLPADLPAQLTVDVSGLLEVDQAVHLREVELPQGVNLVHADTDEVVVKVIPLRVREEAPPAVEAVPEAEVAPTAEGAAAPEEAEKPASE